MAGLSVGAHAQMSSSAVPDIDQTESVVEAAPDVPPAPPVSGELVPRLAEPAKSGQTEENPPAFVSGDRLTGYNERGVVLEGNAELRRGGAVVKGDKLTYDQDTDEAFVHGNARVSRGGALAVGPEARLKVEANEGYMLSPDYYFQQTGGTGKAERIDFVDKDRSVIKRATYTTCSPDNADWYFSARQLDLDSDREVGVAYGGVLHFFDVPIAAAPVFSFPLTDERRSGFLSPLFGYGSKSGLDVTLPYYFNIAPNRDLTLYPRIMTSRGFMLGGDYRYIGQGYSGRLRAEILPDDRQTGSNRWSYSFQHTQNLAKGLNAYLNLNRVSDDRYPDDLTRTVAQSTQRQYVQEGGVTYNWQDFTVLARVQKFQTLLPSQPSYERVPQLNGKYMRYDLGGFDVQVEADYTRFRIPLTSTGFQQPQGERMFVQPTISYPIVRPGWYATPKVIFNATQYQMEAQSNTPTAQNNLSRTVPTFSFDSGMTFERDAPTMSRLFGVNYLQTLEPRLFYVYTPFRDQSQFPLFDTVQSDFGYGQIFSENPFTGYDRIADNNKLTAGLTTRLIESDTGVERFRGTIAQRYDFSGQRVQINGTLPDPRPAARTCWRPRRSSCSAATTSTRVSNTIRTRNTSTIRTWRLPGVRSHASCSMSLPLPARHVGDGQYRHRPVRDFRSVADHPARLRHRPFRVRPQCQPDGRCAGRPGIRGRLLGWPRGLPALSQHHAGLYRPHLPAGGVPRAVENRLESAGYLAPECSWVRAGHRQAGADDPVRSL